MSHPRTGAHRPNQHERQQRRAAIEHLLARALRGALTVPEAAVLADYWRAEQRAADATRKSLTDTTRALTKHREAADAAIRELEQRAERAEAELMARVEADSADAAAGSYAHRAEQAERALADMNRDRDRWWEAAGRAAEQRVEQHRRALADALAVDPDTTWPQLIQHAEALLEAATGGAPIPYQLTEQAERAVVTDREAIRNALDEPEPVECRHPYHRHEVIPPGPECQ